ncbi:MAG: response regulator transcription factor [Anaerolineaceae bacterium]
MSGEKLKILVVDDEAAIRRFLHAALSANGHTVFEVDTGEGAIVMLEKHRPDLLILDLGLPDADGIDIIREVREWNNLPIIILSVRDHEEDKIIALDTGADDYLTKPFGVGELLARIRGVMRRVGGEISGGVLVMGLLKMDLDRREVSLNGQIMSLTPTEYDLLKILMQNSGKVLTHHQIIDRVWGTHLGEEDRLLRVNISNLRHKLEPDPNRPMFILTELGVGYRMNDET